MDLEWPSPGAPAVKRITLIAEYDDGMAVAFTADKPVLPQFKITDPMGAYALGPADLGIAPQIAPAISTVAEVTIGFRQNMREGIKFRYLTAADVAPAFDAVAPEAPGDSPYQPSSGATGNAPTV